MNIWAKLSEIRSYYIYGVTMIVALISVLVPIPMSPPVPAHVKLIYDTIEALPPGSRVVMSADNNAGFYARHYGAQVAIVRHLLRRPVKIYFIGLGYEDGPIIISKVLEWVAGDIKANNKVYGIDYVHLGYVAGFESAFAAFCRDVRGTVSVDYYGTPIDNLPIMEGFKSARDVDLWIQVGPPLFTPAIRQFAIPFNKGKNLVAIGFEGYLSTYIPYMEAGQLLSGMQGSQDGIVYEMLIGKPFIATAQYRGGNLLMFMAMAIIIAGNIVYFMGKRRQS